MPTSIGQLIRLGFNNTQSATNTLEKHPELNQILPTLTNVADPDLALTQLARLTEAGHKIETLQQNLPNNKWQRLTMLLGGSRPLGDSLITNPKNNLNIPNVATNPRQDLFTAIGANTNTNRPTATLGPDNTITDPTNALRKKYRKLLTRIAANDLSSNNPLNEISKTSQTLADLAEAALDAALAVARALHDPEGKVDLAILTLGKTGAKELNYVSDVDVIFLTSSDTPEALNVAGQLAVTLTEVCSAPGIEPPLWTLDAALRPEGRDGALVRTLDSALEYYGRWAQNWEFQALLKASPAAGDKHIAARFIEQVEPLVWSAANRPGFISGTQAMRTQVERSVRVADRGRELKLSAGGLRDIEFTVQLLQLVHGQTNKTIRIANTLEAIDALAEAGFIARNNAEELSAGYRFLRLVEHRVQLQGLRRTHTLPASEVALRSLARSLGRESFPTAEALEKYLSTLRKRLRALHKDIYYRPIIAASASISAAESALNTTEAKERLKTIGYVDPQGALQAIDALTSGTSRRALIQRNLAPVILQWISEGTDPDMGIQSFRILSEQIGGSHWYLSLLRDSGLAARRLCSVLSNSRWAKTALSTIPRAISWLDSDELLSPRPKAELADEAEAIINRYDLSEPALRRVASIVTREVTRAGISDCTIEVVPWRPAISDVVDVMISSALYLALRERREEIGYEEVRVSAIALGRYGGREATYASDIDLMFVHDAVPGIDLDQATKAATSLVNRVRELLTEFKQQGMTSIDFDLRPEGRQGPISRSLESYRIYYEQWAATWERQALLRARIVSGDTDLGASFTEMIDAIRWGSGLEDEQAREIRLLKARMERERLPRGQKPGMHVKLGPGGLSDVEWTVQMLQLRHAHEHRTLRVGSTLPAIDALAEEGYFSPEQAEDLRRAWKLAARVRAANVLATDRVQSERVDVIPSGVRGGTSVASLLGFRGNSEDDLVQQWLFASRRARDVMEECFWG